MLRNSSFDLFKRYIENVIAVHFSSTKLVKPLVASLYATIQCNFRCIYCDDGSGTVYPDLPEKKKMDTEQTRKVLAIMRKASPGINITGGEPTLRKDIDELFDYIDELDFYPVIFDTNAFLLDRHLQVLHNIDYLVISLDAVDEARFDKLINAGRGGNSRRVLANLKLSKQHKKEHKLAFDTIINTVILPETIDDAWDVWEYCLEEGYFWLPAPHIVGKYPNPGLIDNLRWHRLIDEVIRAKKEGAKICGNLPSLRTIRDFTRFECYPTTRPMIYPNGDLLYPCGPLQTIAGNLLEIGDYFKAIEIGMRKHGPIPHCDSRCHLACFMEASLAIVHPVEAIVELIRHAGRGKRRPKINRPRRTALEKPPALHTLRALPSLPPDEIRRLRQAAWEDG